MSTAYIHLDRGTPLSEQPGKGHNRWHPDIEPVVRIAPGSSVEMQTIDAVDTQIQRGMKPEAVLSCNLGRAHPLTGPVYVEGAEPGDLLSVKIESIHTHNYAFTFIMPGVGYLRDLFHEPFLVHWDIANGYAESEQLPGVRIPGTPFMGVMGVAPSQELVSRIVSREAELAARGGFALPPDKAGAVPSTEPIASTAFRTIAPHENGGNFDIKQLIAGSTLYLPVWVPGANFSTGDTHFAQGDGETCITAIETSSTFKAKFDLLKGEAKRRNQIDPSFICAPHPDDARPKGYYATTGTPVRKENGVAESEDLNIACRNALINMIDYIVDAYGYTREQAYCITSVAVNMRISNLVDVPNFVVSAFLPLDIFTK
jgi:formamidase